ncbi:hypothetical protein HMPREF1565_0278 [Providencia alcalifaciens RIMD 1656011]|nr:hypothetical protein HMPREF1565_0278 [Providencia alcalifaciens RIMD 1656011]
MAYQFLSPKTAHIIAPLVGYSKNKTRAGQEMHNHKNISVERFHSTHLNV